MFDSESALELNSEAVTLTPGTFCKPVNKTNYVEAIFTIFSQTTHITSWSLAHLSGKHCINTDVLEEHAASIFGLVEEALFWIEFACCR